MTSASKCAPEWTIETLAARLESGVPVAHLEAEQRELLEHCAGCYRCRDLLGMFRDVCRGLEGSGTVRILPLQPIRHSKESDPSGAVQPGDGGYDHELAADTGSEGTRLVSPAGLTLETPDREYFVRFQPSDEAGYVLVYLLRATLADDTPSGFPVPEDTEFMLRVAGEPHRFEHSSGRMVLGLHGPIPSADALALEVRN